MPSEQARNEAIRLIAKLDAVDLGAFASNTYAELERRGFVVRIVAPSGDGAGCSVAGSFQPGDPPIISVASDPSFGRRRFTALHEFGHSLILEDDVVHDLLFAQPDLGDRLTEEICDAIAAELLLPVALVDGYIDANGPTARSVLDLFHGSEASREAVCVRAAQRIRGAGHVMLASDGVALFTASNGTQFRVRRGAAQGDDHITATAQLRGSARGPATVRYPSGAVSELFHADAVADDDGYVFAVFVEDRAPWQHGFTLPIVDRAVEIEVECIRCDVQFTTVAAPCSRCSDYVHSSGCGRCSCAAAAERLCTACFNRKGAHLFLSADVDTCIDCEE